MKSGNPKTIVTSAREDRWSIVLAGGEGIRLRPLTRLICGDDRPKQFCPLVGDDTLLDQTRRRAESAVAPEQIVYVVTRSHEGHYRRELRGQPSVRIVQPCNRGTAPAILSGLLHISQRSQDALVAILPSDHYYGIEAGFTAALESAFKVARERPREVVLIGAPASGPEVEYGWIQVGQAAGSDQGQIFHIAAFHEKPSFESAQRLWKQGSLWNTFVMVGHVHAFLEMAHESVPALLDTLEFGCLLGGAGEEVQISDQVYRQIDAVDFSRHVLSLGTRRLVTLPLGHGLWNDLGDPERVLATLLSIDTRLPAWALRWRDATRSQNSSHVAVNAPGVQ